MVTRVRDPGRRSGLLFNALQHYAPAFLQASSSVPRDRGAGSRVADTGSLAAVVAVAVAVEGGGPPASGAAGGAGAGQEVVLEAMEELWSEAKDGAWARLLDASGRVGSGLALGVCSLNWFPFCPTRKKAKARTASWPDHT